MSYIPKVFTDPEKEAMIYQPFQALPRESLHFLYGVNCYHFAVGYPYPIFAKIDLQGFIIIKYIEITSGLPSRIKKFADLITSNDTGLSDFIGCTIEGCTEDSIENCGRELVRRPGYQTLALFFGASEYKGMDKYDFHFANVCEDGSLKYKVPCQPAQHVESISMTEVETGCDFHSFLLAPNNMKPKIMTGWETRKIAIQTPNGNAVEIEELLSMPRGVGVSVSNQLALMPPVAFLIQSNPLRVPSPLWPNEIPFMPSEFSSSIERSLDDPVRGEENERNIAALVKTLGLF